MRIVLLVLLLVVSAAWADDTPTPTETETPTPTPTCIPQAGVPNTMVVTTTDDHNDSCCSATDCTLREAINVADPEFTITFCTGVDTPIVGCPGAVTGTITLGCNSRMNIGESGTLTGPGASVLTISGNDCSGILRYIHTNGDSGIFTLSGVTLAHSSGAALDFGFTGSGTQTAIITNVIFDSNHTSIGGGAILGEPHTSIHVSDTTFSNNSADGQGGVYLAQDDAADTFTGVTFVGNTSNEGGAIEGCSQRNVMTIANSTFSGNSATTTGGAIDWCPFPAPNTLTLINTTFSGNTDTSGANDLFDWTDSLTVATNSIFASGCTIQTPANITSGGHNIDVGTSCNLSGTGDQQNSNPLLNALASNGGATQTMSLQASSPAINGGDDTVCAAAPVNGVDQRGQTRPGFGQTHCSVGAYEEQAATPTPTETPTPCSAVVTSDADTDCPDPTLRCALTNGCTTITFNIPTPGVHTITVGSTLSVTAAGTTIDASTQPGAATPNMCGATPTPGVFTIVLDGGNTVAPVLQALLGANNTTIKGFEIRNGAHASGNASTYGIVLASDTDTALGNYVHDCWGGISCTQTGCVVGDVASGVGNVTGNNVVGGITLFGDLGTAVGNFTGTDLTGTSAAPNDKGIYVESGNANTVGAVGCGRNVASGNANFGVEVKSGVTATVIQYNYIGRNVSDTADLCNGTAPISDNGTGTILTANVTACEATPTPTPTPQSGCYVLAGAGCNVPPISAPVTCLDITVAAGFGQPTIADGCTFINGLVPGCCLTLVADAPGCDPLGNALGACTAPTPTPTDTPAVTPTNTPTPTPTSVGCCQSVGKGCWCAKSATPPPTSGLVCQEIAAPLCSIGVKSSRCCGGTNRGAICVSDNDCPGGGTCEPCAVTSWAAAQTCNGFPNEQCVGVATFTPTRTRTFTKTPTPTRTFTPTQTFTPHAGHPSYVNLACPTPPCVGTPVPAGPGWKTAFFSQESGTCTQDVYCQSPSKNATPVPVQCIGGYTDVTGDGYCTFRTNCYQAMCAVTGSTSCVASCWIEDWQEWTQRYPQ